MKYIPLSSDTNSQWDELLQSSDDGWVFSTSAWIDMVCPVWDIEDKSFAIQENGKLVAAVPLQWIKRESRLSSGGWGHGGTFIHNNASQTDRNRLARSCWSHVEDMAKDLQAKSITASISPVCLASIHNQRGVNPLILSGFTDKSTHALIINLSKSKDQLWLDLAKDARQKIKIAREAGYTVKRVEWRQMVDTYYAIHQETYQRTGVTPLPFAYFEGISRLPIDNFVLWAGFDKNNSVIAFHNNARFAKQGMYHTGCSKTDHLSSGINYLLFWEALSSAKDDGLEWYEAGEAFPEVKSGKSKGLTDFKSKFGGDFHRSFRGEIILPPSIATNLSPNPHSNADNKSIKTLLRDWIILTLILLKKMIKKVYNFLLFQFKIKN